MLWCIVVNVLFWCVVSMMCCLVNGCLLIGLNICGCVSVS